MRGLKIAGLLIALFCFAVVCYAWLPGRMTGGGSVFVGQNEDIQVDINGGTDELMRVTHGFEIHCQAEGTLLPPTPNNLEINWPGNRFHLDVLTLGICSWDSTIDPRPPAAGFNTFTGIGTGKLNGEDVATIYFVFKDAGERGTNDTEQVTIIRDSDGFTALDFGPLYLTFGNHQAHKK